VEPPPSTFNSARDEAGIALDETHVYFTDRDARVVFSAAKDGGHLTVLARKTELLSTLLNVAVDATCVYYTTNGGGSGSNTVFGTLTRAPK
jgi:hypothetical protein